MKMRFPDFISRVQLLGRRAISRLDLYSLAGAGVALLVLFLFYILLVAPEGDSVSTLASVIALAIALSPLVVAFRIEQTVGMKIFTDFGDFSLAVAWFPLTMLALLLTENTAVIWSVMICGFLIDPVLLASRRAAYPGKTRAMMAYSRGLCGIIGTVLMLTFVGKLMEIGDPKNKKSLAQEILGAVIWGYIGKKFFDFIGVTRPLSLSGVVPGKGNP